MKPCDGNSSELNSSYRKLPQIPKWWTLAALTEVVKPHIQ